MLTSKEILNSERLTEEYGERRQTHFREESAGLDGPAPQGNLTALKRESLTQRLEESSHDPELTTMRIQLRPDQHTGEMLLVQTIFDPRSNDVSGSHLVDE